MLLQNGISLLLHIASPCDGIEGTVKQLVARASLQATKRNHILTAEDLYNWTKGIKFFYITQKENKAHILRLTDRLQYVKTVPGTWKHCEFVPINTSGLKIHLLSLDKEDMSTKVSVTCLTDVAVERNQLCPKRMCCCMIHQM
jgi:hypothetical protein